MENKPVNATSKDEIKQWEIASLFHLNTTMEVLALSLRRRIASGATIEAGDYALEAGEFTDPTDSVEPTDFNVTGFDNVGWHPPQSNRGGRRGKARRR